MVQEVITRLARDAQRQYYGKYRGLVSDNADPDNRGRIKVRVPSVLGTAVSGWAEACLPYGGLKDVGFFSVPPVDAQVWVEFEEGNVSRPIWTGTVWQVSSDVPEDAGASAPDVRVLKTRSGHMLLFDDTDDAEVLRVVHHTGAEIGIDETGAISITTPGENELTLAGDEGQIEAVDGNGNRLRMNSGGMRIEDSNGNTVEMTSSGVTVKATSVNVDAQSVQLGGSGGEPVIKGRSFVSMYMTHVHPTGVGPSGPPVPQGELSALSMKVMSA